MNKPFVNKGLNWSKELSEESEKDWIVAVDPVVGAKPLPDFAEIPEDKRRDFLPVGELQFGLEDFMDCATRSPLNILETKLTYLYQTKKISTADSDWLERSGYVKDNRITLSDRFTAMSSGTTRDGNSLKAPLDSIRKDGVIPKSLLPASSTMNFDQYHDRTKITQAMRDLGQDFLKRFQINYEKVYSEHFAEVLVKDLIDVAGYAWPDPDATGIYPQITSQPNHAFVIWKNPPYFAFDNYIDTHDNDFIKQLAANYELTHGYRVLVNEVKKNESIAEDKSFWSFLAWLFHRDR